jgi:hypothetical protein
VKRGIFRDYVQFYKLLMKEGIVIYLNLPTHYIQNLVAEIVQSVYRLNTRCKVRGSKPCGGEIFRNRLDRPEAHLPPVQWVQVLYRRVKRPTCGTDPPPSPPSSAEVVHG